MPTHARSAAAALLLAAACAPRPRPQPAVAMPVTSQPDATSATLTADAGVEAAPVAAPTTCVGPAGGVRGKVALGSVRRDGRLLGVDVAHYEGLVDWGAVAAAGVSFVYIKATEGVDFVDPCFRRNWEAVRAAGLRRGAYHFFHPGFDPAAQARHFVAVVGTLEPGDLPPAFGLEYAKDLDKVSVAGAIEHAETWLSETGAALHRRPIIYSSARVFRDYLRNTRRFDGYSFWLADYKAADLERGAPALTPGEKQWTIWQLADDVEVPGIGIAADVSWFDGSTAELDAFVSASALP